MYSKIIKLSTLIVMPFLLSSSHLELTESDIQNHRDYYEVIGATTGKKEEAEVYALDEIVKTHAITVSALRKAMIKEGIDTSQVEILVYYDPLIIRDDSPPRIWNSKPHPDTITSPWLDVTKIKTTSGGTKITIRIDATSARVVSDLFSESEGKKNTNSFLSIPSIRESCLWWMTARYTEAKFEGGLTPDNLYCAPKELRKPLISLFRSAKPSTGSLDEPVIFEFVYYCQDAAREYYSKLYPRLVVQALQILESKSDVYSQWWKRIIEQVEPIQECK